MAKVTIGYEHDGRPKFVEVITGEPVEVDDAARDIREAAAGVLPGETHNGSHRRAVERTIANRLEKRDAELVGVVLDAVLAHIRSEPDRAASREERLDAAFISGTLAAMVRPHLDAVRNGFRVPK